MAKVAIYSNIYTEPFTVFTSSLLFSKKIRPFLGGTAEWRLHAKQQSQMTTALLLKGHIRLSNHICQEKFYPPLEQQTPEGD